MIQYKDGYRTNLAEGEMSRVLSFFSLLPSFPIFLQESLFSRHSSQMCGTCAKEVSHLEVALLSEAPQREAIERGEVQRTTGTDTLIRN